MSSTRYLAEILGPEWAVSSAFMQSMMAIADREVTDPEAVEARQGRPLENTHRAEVRGSVAVIPVMGPLMRHAGMLTRVCGATSYAAVAQDLRAALDNKAVSAIVLNIDSPGGAANGVAELASHIYEARKEKTVVAYVGGAGASAAYWLASAATSIVANKTAMLGSVGVVVGVSKGEGGSSEIVSSQSPYKNMDPATAEGRALIQKRVDNMAAIFIGDVAQYRGKSADHVSENFGRGDVLLGQAALDAGMIDRLGTFEGLIAELNAEHAMKTTKGISMNAHDLRTQYPEAVAEIEAAARASVDVDGEKTKAAQDATVRVLGIIGHPEAKGREALALKLAGMPSMTVESAGEALSVAPKAVDAVTPGKEFEAAMTKINPKVEADAATGKEDDSAEACAASIIAAGSKHGI